jgi:hypothetical protein
MFSSLYIVSAGDSLTHDMGPRAKVACFTTLSSHHCGGRLITFSIIDTASPSQDRAGLSDPMITKRSSDLRKGIKK